MVYLEFCCREFIQCNEVGGLGEPANDRQDNRLARANRQSGDKVYGHMQPWPMGSSECLEQTEGH